MVLAQQIQKHFITEITGTQLHKRCSIPRLHLRPVFLYRLPEVPRDGKRHLNSLLARLNNCIDCKISALVFANEPRHQ